MTCPYGRSYNPVPQVRTLFDSHFGNRLQGPSTFPLISLPRHRYNRTTQVIYKITAFFDNLTRSQLLAICQLLSPTNKAKAKTFVRRFAVVRERRRNRLGRHANSNV
jgi:hypothetical protein